MKYITEEQKNRLEALPMVAFVEDDNIVFTWDSNYKTDIQKIEAELMLKLQAKGIKMFDIQITNDGDVAEEYGELIVYTLDLTIPFDTNNTDDIVSVMK